MTNSKQNWQSSEYFKGMTFLEIDKKQWPRET